ncbi:helix-turn-helix domain-containing protein [Blastococcus sp. CT_GayMR16]|uniref:winged helix-turn-helix transcriptional regulator n=1 Tax=Blastococcus sp. CT_GayMR16 TaxID=2559607 RepID=UPI001072F45C|nr:helix-turn-helix domain-containing protein [Blastococcus sp. CT_GayMR16]TFV87166.1 transcriptional regulator [Blastococcus sp. CT_GayMR16]
MTDERLAQSSCSVARSLGVLGERWTILILREALSGTTRFADFRTALGVAADVLSDRLATLVDAGVMVREPYQEPGSRSRFAYHLTDAGRELELVLGSLQQWGDRYLPRPEGPTVERRAVPTDRLVHVAFVDDEGCEVPPAEVAAVRTAAYPVVVPSS